jgi:spore maturation protein CgeB
MKLLVMLNENSAGAHDDVYRAIDNCIHKGIISEKYIYPFLAKLSVGAKEKEVLNEILNFCKSYLPDLILWMHTGKFNISKNIIREIRNLKSGPIMGYWDGDIYQSLFQSVPNEVLNLSAECDVIFLQGFGDMSRKMEAKGCKDIRFVPAFGDEKRFYPIKNSKKEYDIVMIGNYITSRNPFRITLPGTKFRKEIADAFSERYGNKFAVFGNNWKGSYAKGIVPYFEQHKIYSKSRVAFSINSNSGKYYFSDRLPIAMLAGIPIIQNYEEGFDELFKDCKELRIFKSIEEVLLHCEELLNKSEHERREIGCKLNYYAMKKFTAKFAFQYMIIVLKEVYSKKKGKDFNNKTQNPWLETIPKL